MISFNNLKDPDSSNLLQENNRLSSELNSLKTKIRDYESIQEELETFQNENKSLKSEIIVLQCKQQKENEFNEILKEFETNFRKKILEVESEKEYYKGLNKQYLIEKNNIKLEKEEKIYELEFLIGELTKNLKEKEENLILIQKKPQFKNSFVHETKFTELKEENNKILIDLQEKNLEVGVWKEKFYELLDEKNKNEKEKFTNNINDQSNSKYFQTISQQNLEINSMRIQIKEMAEKMEILNRIIESKCEEKENLEIELNVYKKKFQELEKKTKVYLKFFFIKIKKIFLG